MVAAVARTPGSRATSAAAAAGSGAPARPPSTRSAITRAAVTSSVCRWSLVWIRPQVPASMATSTTGVASAAVRQRLAASPVLASRPAAPRRRSGHATHGGGDAQQPAAEQTGAAGQQHAAEDRERLRPDAVEHERHGDAAGQGQHPA